VVVQVTRFCKETWVNNVIVEGDAFTIITVLNISRYGYLVEEVRMIFNF
jgi:hypothetical protein